MGAGIDYGCGQSNVDHETGIRFGVISEGSLLPEALDDLEPGYPDVEHRDGCPNSDDEGYCSCGDMSEPIAYTYVQEGYLLSSGTSGFGIFVEKSPYYTLCQFCSPCAPGAGNLDSPDPDGVRTYCLGPDWFEGRIAPYPVYSVATGEVFS